MSPLPVAEIIRLLAGEYGDIRWRKHRGPLSELIMTILSQNTSDLNSRRAFDQLDTRFASWDAMAGAGVEDIARTIKSGGLAAVKAPRIKAILERISAERGSFDLDFLGGMPVDEAKAWLEALPGVGPKTAACVLLFALGKPVLPVDTHIHRVAKRLGLIGSGVSAEKAHEVLGAVVPSDDVYRFHILLIEHGRAVCRAQNPQCHRCVLLPGCPSGQLLLGTTSEHKVKA